MKKKQAVRKIFRDTCLKRDNYKCKVCGFKGEFDEELEVHHITDRNELPEELKYVPENGVTLCNPCHQKAEQFHITGGKSWTHQMHPNDLYKLIGSTWETKAFAHSITELIPLH